MKRILWLVILAGCAAAPERERLEVRHAAAGEPLMPGLTCVSVEIGSPVRIVVRNDGAEDRAIVWYPRWRTGDGYVVKTRERVRELVVPGGGEAAIVAMPPAPDARQFEILVGDRP